MQVVEGITTHTNVPESGKQKIAFILAKIRECGED